MARYSIDTPPNLRSPPPVVSAAGVAGAKAERSRGEAGFLGTKFRGQDLNLRPPGYEPGELPLLHPGIHSISLLLRGRLGPSAGMSAESPGGRELSQLVADHVLGDEHLHELPAVVNQEREADEVRH